jgi:hypothetical protein
VKSNTSETEWLLACCSEALELSPDGIFTPVAGFAWPHVFALADRHDVIPLIHAGMKRSAGKPPWFSCQVAARARQIATWNLQLAVQLTLLDESLRAAGIRPIFFKGPALAQQLYGSLALRQCRDIDLFVERSAVRPAVEVMKALGYAAECPSVDGRCDDLFGRCKDIVFTHPESRILVELHWAVCEPGFDAELHREHLTVRTQPVSLLGREVDVPIPEDLLFLLCIHGARHYWGSLKWICDVARILQTCPGLDWTGAFQMAQSFDRVRAILLGIRLAQMLFQLPVPAVAASLMAQHPAISELTDETCGFLFSEHYFLFPHGETPLLESKPAAETDIVRKLFRVRSLDGFAHRRGEVLKVIREFVRPDPEDFATRPTLSKFRALFWIIQPFRVIRSYGVFFFLRTSLQLVKSLAV